MNYVNWSKKNLYVGKHLYALTQSFIVPYFNGSY